MQQQSKGYLFLLLVLGLAIVSGVLYTLQPYQLGLDVQGGVRLTYEMDTSQLSPEQRASIGQVRSNMVNILRNRAQGTLAVAEPSVQLKGVNEFIVELPGFTDAEEARRILSSTAKLIAYHARNVATPKAEYRKFIRGDEAVVEGAPVVTFVERGRADVELKPGNPKYIEMIEGWAKILEGDDLTRAEARVEGTRTLPFFYFSRSGGAKMERWTRSVMNRGEMLAFVLDGRVLSIAPLRDGVILKTDAFIEGDFDPAYVNGLVKLLNAGALPVSLVETSSQKVDPTIGSFALDQMIRAGFIAFGFISVFLIAYYMFPGIVALIALGLYTLFTLTVLKWTGATFSLAAIAGFILSIGIAVDANILVFERLKEELRQGKTLTTAVNLGFNRAFPAILDSNLCTILTSLVLYFLGSGPVKGFATTLIIGVAISLFTALTVTRSLLLFLMASGLGNNPKVFGLSRQWFGEHLEAKAGVEPLRVVGQAKKWLLISAIPIVPGLIFMGLGGFKPNVEFLGGISAEYSAAEDVTSGAVLRKMTAAGIKGGNVKFAQSADTRLMSLTVPETEDLKASDPEVGAKLSAKLELEPTTLKSISTVGPTVQAETYRNAILGIVIAAGLIVVYLAVRFGVAVGGFLPGMKFAFSAIGALIHDVLVVLGIAAMLGYFLGWEISGLFITAMLTVIGFSVHDTIVVFDRVRENLEHHTKGEDFEHLCNRSITQSFARSINTSVAVVVPLFILITWGTPTVDLKFFCLAMLVGIVSGTYSSLYNATPILYLWDRRNVRKGGEEASLVSEAEQQLQRRRAAALTMTAPPPGAPGVDGSGYGQVKRRTSAVEQSKRSVDDE